MNRVKQSRAERVQELGRNWGGVRNVTDRSLKGAGQEYGRGWGWGRSRVGAEQKHERSRRVARWEYNYYYDHYNFVI